MDIKEFFSRDNTEASRHPWELARLFFVERILLNIIHTSPSQSLKLLDFGCGDAFVAANLASKFSSLDIVGIDNAFNDKIIAHCYQNYPYKNLCLDNSLKENCYYKNFFDIVLLLDVIEHIENDIEFLNNLVKNKIFNSQSYFIITAPAFSSLFSHHDKLLGHYRRYTLCELIRLAEKSGLNVVDSGYFFMVPLFLRTLNVIREKFSLIRLRDSTDLAAWNHGSVLTKLIYYILCGDIMFSLNCPKFYLKPLGLSGYVICQKHG